MHILIDSRGREWDLGEPFIYRHLGFRGSTRELTDFVIRNLGYVGVQADGSRVAIRLRPDYFSQIAFETLVAVIGALDPYRIIIRAEIDGPECVDILTDLGDAVARLHQLRTSKAAAQRTQFFADTLSFGRLAEQPTGSLNAVYRRWCASRGRLPHQILRRMLDEPLRAPWMLGRFDRSNGLVTRTAPEYINFWGDRHRASLLDKPMAAHPDAAFGKAAERTYLAVHRDEKPSLELVTTVVQPPEGPLHWGRYQRLILPWRTSDGSVLLSSVSAVRVARDLVSAAAR